MVELLIASTQADARAVEAVEQHHATMAGALRLAVHTLLAEAVRGDGAAAEAARRDLVSWCDRELLPHALAEEQALYPAAHATTAGRPLVEAMLWDHAVISSLVDDLRGASDPVRSAATATALRTVFESHLHKENNLVLPLLAGDPSVSVAELLDGMHEVLGGTDAGPDADGSADAVDAVGCGGHTCSCGEKDGPALPELDVRAVPQVIRHATVFNALESVAPGAGVLLIAPHDPLPLLRQIEKRWPGVFEVSYLQRGPDAWRLELVRAA
jgi:uncharacterized protein (DUF2249 family)/iron-sulfur cluster repair protein YtfE (RIC family)